MKKILIASALALSMATPAFANDDADLKVKFDQHDTNKDGSISPSEWEAGSKQMWKEADANSDGKVTFEEKKAFADKHDD